MRSILELGREGLCGKALTDAHYKEMFGHLPPDPDPTPEQMDAARARFFAIMDSLTEEELAENPFEDRPTNLSVIDCKPMIRSNAS